ncbi:MAG: family 10 glycosylhydrolase [Tannerella sp.]|nr:family 10 glycosylhydrolase [Tannerella sp.]
MNPVFLSGRLLSAIRVAVRMTALSLCLISCAASRQFKQEQMLSPKREFRGAWIQTVFQEDYLNLTPASFRRLMEERLDRLRACGINAILFQVRPEADAFYRSPYEPWSRFLTGRQGVPPDEPDFDPMAFLVDACHRRNMEFHAWLNPYRAGTAGFNGFAASHVLHRHPEWFVKYNGQTLFDPGVPDCRVFICRVVEDIVSRYDVDAIHMDDYFYPYPVAGQKFPDDRSFERYGRSGGYRPEERDEWRRENVNQLIRMLRQTIRQTKPWVRLGISPFGIYRNGGKGRTGSRTSGLQNYDDLYADVLLWMEKGWIDYCAPQLYWEIGHPSADYETLIRWWNDRKCRTPLYIGQDVARTMKAGQLKEKMRQSRMEKRVQGNIFWPANELLWNNGGVADSLKRLYHRYPALIPAFEGLHDRKPERIKHLRVEQTGRGQVLRWDIDASHRWPPDEPAYFVIYRFRKGEKMNLERSKAIYAITRNLSCPIPAGNVPYRYAVTAVDRFHNESKAGKVISD